MSYRNLVLGKEIQPNLVFISGLTNSTQDQYHIYFRYCYLFFLCYNEKIKIRVTMVRVGSRFYPTDEKSYNKPVMSG